MLNLIQLESLYTSYGFTSTKDSERCPVFLYSKSRYFGVDIIVLLGDLQEDDIIEAQRIASKYKASGYAVNIKKIRNNEEAELELFKSFFNYDGTRQRLRRKYSDFSEKQTKALLGSTYEYVPSPVEMDLVDDHEQLFERIDKLITSSAAELVVIEAAAGYGKTCTAYEILKNNIDCHQNIIPIFTELARHRSLKVFRYILLDEIDREHPSLSSQLVIREIKNGRIPLIIDGFDELLAKINSEDISNDSFDDVESMLDTISNLLENKTKVILTTRKTAIFTSTEFEKWMSKRENKFNVTRIVIKEPRLKDWLGEIKYSYVHEHNVPVENLANPVILSFLKNTSFDEFLDLVTEPQKLVNHYFERMLERERTRQNLIMTVENQLQVFENVARTLLELDSTTTEKNFLKEIILDGNKKLIDYTRNMYGAIDRPSTDELVNTLSNHALLDAKGRDKDQIGFINDFVFGILIGKIICHLPKEKLAGEVSSNMIDLAVTAYRVQNDQEKRLLWEQVQHILYKFNSNDIFKIDIYLRSELQRDYREISLYEISFFGVSFETYVINSSVFINCRFKSCGFFSKSFKDTSFINCFFEDCIVIDSAYLFNDNDVVLIKCTQRESNIYKEEQLYQQEDRVHNLTEFQKDVLHQLWTISNSKTQHMAKLMRRFPHVARREVSDSLKRLEELGLIILRGSYIHLVINKIGYIREILDI